MSTNYERSFFMIKPDAVQRKLIGKLIERFEVVGFKIIALKMIQVFFIIFKILFRQQNNSYMIIIKNIWEKVLLMNWLILWNLDH